MRINFLTIKRYDMTLLISQQDALKAKFKDAVRNYLSPTSLEDKAKNKELAAQMRDVLLIVGFPQTEINNLIDKAKEDEFLNKCSTPTLKNHL